MAGISSSTSSMIQPVIEEHSGQQMSPTNPAIEMQNQLDQRPVMLFAR
jgi:hypothetical protein